MLAGALVVALWQAPDAVAAAGVAVRLAGGAEPVFVDAGRIEQAADVPVTEYVLRSADGGEERVFQTGTRLATALTLAGLDPAAVSFLEIERPDGSVLALVREAVDPASGGPPPLVWVDGDTVGFVRPSAGPGDPNERDAFSFASGAPLRVTARTGALLTVTARAGRTRLRAGARVAFSGAAAGGASGELLTFEWRFGDGTTTVGSRAWHTFRRPGTYHVVLRVTGDRDSGGTSEPLSIQVGEPASRGEGPGGGSSPERGAPESGPQEPGREGGQPSPVGEPAAPAERTAPVGPAARAEPTAPAEDAAGRRAARADGEQVRGLRIGRVGPPVEPVRAADAPVARAGGPEPDVGESMVLPAGALVALALLAVGVWREAKES